MKKKLFTTLVVMGALIITNQLHAQDNAKPDQMMRSKSNVKNNHIVKNDEVSVVKIERTADGCSIIFGNQIRPPKNPASGLPTGKRMHKPITITSEIGVMSKDNSMKVVSNPGDGGASGLPTGKRMAGTQIGGIVVKGGRNPGGQEFNKIVVENGQFTLPADCPDGEYNMVLSWSWGASNPGSTKRCEKTFRLTMENGVCKGIQESGIK